MPQKNITYGGEPTISQVNHGREGSQTNITVDGKPKITQRNYTAADLAKAAREMNLGQGDLARDKEGFFKKLQTKLPGLSWDVFIALLPLVFR